MFLWSWTVQLFPLWLKAESDAARLSLLNQSFQNSIYKVHEIPGFREISILLTNSEVPFMFFLEWVFGQIDNISRFYSNLRFVHRETIVSKHFLLQQSYQSIFATEVLDVSALGKDPLPILVLIFLGLGLCQLNSVWWSNMIKQNKRCKITFKPMPLLFS